MFDVTYLYYGSIAFLILTSSIGTGLGQGWAAYAALQASDIQPHAARDIARVSIIGMALIETSAILSIIMILFLLKTHLPAHTYGYYTYIGIAASIGLSGCVTGFFSAFPIIQASYAIARQPFFVTSISRIMMITQTIIQTPLIFGFLIALFIYHQIPIIEDLSNSMRLIASGICMGLGSIGPSMGLALFAQAACKGSGINRGAFSQLLSFSFMSMAIIETPLIFSFIMSILLIFAHIPGDFLLRGVAFLAAGLCVGLSTIGPGLSSGKTASAACAHIALDPKKYQEMSRVSMLGQALIESTAIYGFLIGLVLFLFI